MTKSGLGNVFLSWIAPALLFITTVFTTLLAGGMQVGGDEQKLLGYLWQGIPFALAMLLIIGAHAFGHYLMARLYGVGAYPPYFVPYLSLIGTSGAFTKMRWPIADRHALLKIFTIGPIAGFCMSWVIYVIGLSMSQVTERVELSQSAITLGDSIITYLTHQMIYGLPDNYDVVLHPVGLAGWAGLHYNVWHLLPIGKLDGGRITYALWGYRVTQWISFITIGVLIALGLFFWNGWLGMAILGVLCMIRLRKQYTSDKYTDAFANSQLCLGLLALVIFVLSFSPIPVSIERF